MVAKKPAAAPAPSVNDVSSALSKLGIKLFNQHTGLPLNQLQRNLDGRTIYAHDSQLKHHVTRIHSVHVMDEGLIVGIVESFQIGATADTGRKYRPVFFDVFGREVHGLERNDALDSEKQAMGKFWQMADEINAVEETMEGIKHKHETLVEECKAYKDVLDELA